MKKICAHLKEVNESYCTHLMTAVRFASLLSLAGVICFLHAVCPFVFPTTASQMVGKINISMQNRIKNKA